MRTIISLRLIILTVLVLTLGSTPSLAVESCALVERVAVANHCAGDCDRVFQVSTRSLCTEACQINPDDDSLRVEPLAGCQSGTMTLEEYRSVLSPDRPVVIYVHGNRMPIDELPSRAASVRQIIRRNRLSGPVDWLIFSWPSERLSPGVGDFRVKADRCDAQGLYLALLVRCHAELAIPTVMIGYSFGARVVTGSLHALAGGALGGRRLSTVPLVGANVRVGLVAPAIESNWLGGRGYHRMATKNIERMVLMYNRRDVVLKRYWLIERVRSETALGFSGPSCFAPRADGTRLPVRSIDCSPAVRLRHSELDYYKKNCNAGSEMARLINGIRRCSTCVQ